MTCNLSRVNPTTKRSSLRRQCRQRRDCPTDRDRILLHQVHPLKLAADISASLISNTLLWQHRPVAGLVTRYALPAVGSAIVLSSADVESLRDTAPGRYILANMSPAAMAVRLAGDVVMAVGSWYRRPPLIAFGLLIVVAGWSGGLLRYTREIPRP